jgi:hypothetical protein
LAPRKLQNFPLIFLNQVKYENENEGVSEKSAAENIQGQKKRMMENIERGEK